MRTISLVAWKKRCSLNLLVSDYSLMVPHGQSSYVRLEKLREFDIARWVSLPQTVNIDTFVIESRPAFWMKECVSFLRLTVTAIFDRLKAKDRYDFSETGTSPPSFREHRFLIRIYVQKVKPWVTNFPTSFSGKLQQRGSISHAFEDIGPMLNGWKVPSMMLIARTTPYTNTAPSFPLSHGVSSFLSITQSTPTCLLLWPLLVTSWSGSERLPNTMKKWILGRTMSRVVARVPDKTSNMRPSGLGKHEQAE
ncbi:uncharacterized protein BO80DRAFT_485032 [Aspergillus ibericus CBS 121593]|uniref:Uncharacterized protein n=1 Tax=Aspergillus ibericus CBS 121593 TaxID=1448316 RepID=A0A395H934_9EURO|nr:hypothetical protein BO80DRAFT_485032 [Aspergillus ibericus CBS 121593]RAL04461.1 hypothetical protein BO80DRAFT_485032 [Aspergillus ibericus CBS 121593]